jgi:hypothetical protein
MSTTARVPLSAHKFAAYQRVGFIHATPWVPHFDMTMVSVSPADRAAGHPMVGGWIAKNPEVNDDMWYIAPEFFAKHYEERRCSRGCWPPKPGTCPACDAMVAA